MKKFLLGLLVLASTTAFAAESKKVTLTKDNVIVMDDYYDSEVVANLAKKAQDMDARLPSDEPMYLILDTGGGSIEAGIELIENLNNLNRKVHTISLFAASMGFQTVEGVKGERLLPSNGTLMSHKARGEFYGEFPGQLDSRYTHYLKRVGRLDKQVVARTNGKHDDKSYAALIENEYWCDGQDCIDQGLADRVVNVSCDASLEGTHTKSWARFIYMGHVIEIIDTMSNCPTITGALSYQIYIDGEPLFEQYLPGSVTNVAKQQAKVQSSYYSYGEFNKAILSTLGLETAENIKKLVAIKVEARNDALVDKTKREVRKY